MNQTEGFDHKLLEIYGELSRDRLMELVVSYARDRLGADGSSIFLRDDITGRYVLRSTTGLQESTGIPNERIDYEPGEGLTGWIAKHGRSLCIANVQDRKALRRIAKDLVWSKKYTEISPAPDRAYLGVPILCRDEKTVLGVLRVSGQEHFGASDEALLKQVAALVSIAIENSQRYEQEKRRARYFELLLGISSELDPRRSIAEMLQAVVDRVRDGFRTEASQIYLRAEDIHRVVLRAASGLPNEWVGELTYMAGEGITGHIVESGTAIHIREPAELKAWKDPYVEQVASHLPSGTYRSFVGVPLQLGEEILGTLELVNKIPSSPGHRDWFTDADESYLRLLSTAIGGVLEGARYLKTLNDVGITAMRMQQVASLGTLAQRILHETANPLAAARLATANLRASMEGATASPTHEAAIGRLDKIEGGLNEVSDKLFNLLTFSQRIGFVRTTTDWNDVVRGALIWLVAERQWRGVEVHTAYAEELPPVSIEPNETFGVVATMLRLALEAFEKPGGLIEISTSLVPGGQRVRTEIHAINPPLREKVVSVLEPTVGEPEELSPLRFEWALAEETVETRYKSSLTWHTHKDDLYFTLELPLREES
jgi:GAF domain-containing protein